MTEVPSRQVKPPSVAECPVNMECRVVQSIQLDGYYPALRVQGSWASPWRSHMSTAMRPTGMWAYTPSTRCSRFRSTGTTPSQARLIYGRMDPDKLHRSPGDFGCKADWVGSFETWIGDEAERGKIDDHEREQILAWGRLWEANRDPVTNAVVKRKLTVALRKLCAPA